MNARDIKEGRTYKIRFKGYLGQRVTVIKISKGVVEYVGDLQIGEYNVYRRYIACETIKEFARAVIKEIKFKQGEPINDN